MLAARITKIQDKPKPEPQKPDLYAQIYIPVGVILNGRVYGDELRLGYQRVQAYLHSYVSMLLHQW